MIENRINDIFWTKGNGKVFLDWANVSENNIQSNYNTKLFYEFDNGVDLLVDNWMKSDDFKNITKSLHSRISEENLPQDYLNLKNNLKIIPDWLDNDLLLEGCKLSERSGLVGLLVLRNFSLLSGYNFVNLTKPLLATASLEKGAV